MNQRPTDRQIMQQALEALELLSRLPTDNALDYASNAIDALRERLAQPEQEPVGTLTISHYKGNLENYDFDYVGTLPDGTYSLYITPPQRKPLSDEQLEAMAEKYVTNCYFDTLKYARSIEAAHGIKGKA